MIERLAEALSDWEPPVPPARDLALVTARGWSPGVRIPPPRRIRITESTMAFGSVRCEICGAGFTVPVS